MMSFLQNRKGTVRAGSNLPGWSIYQADGRKLYKRLIKESTNMALTKNKYLRG